MRRLRRLLLPGAFWCVTALAPLVVLPAARAAETVAKEYQIKAVFLFNLIQYVSWTDSAPRADDAPFAIGVLGENPFGHALDDAVRGEKVKNRPLVVRYAHDVAGLRGCQVIFIANSERSEIPAILAKIGNRPVLTVADTPGFAGEGGDVEFYREGKRVRFAVNVAAAHAHGLRPSAQLLSLARIVDSGGR